MFYKHRRSSASTCHACIDANVHLFLFLLGHITLVSHHVSHVPISTKYLPIMLSLLLTCAYTHLTNIDSFLTDASLPHSHPLHWHSPASFLLFHWSLHHLYILALCPLHV